jgi:hypothetical protein
MSVTNILRHAQYYLPMIPLIFIQFVIFILLNVLDAHSTWSVLKPNHYRRERNPVARWIFRKLGLPKGIIIFKTVLLLFLGVVIAWYASYEPLLLNIVLFVANLVFLLVVIHNYNVCRKMGVRTPFDRRQPNEKDIS